MKGRALSPLPLHGIALEMKTGDYIDRVIPFAEIQGVRKAPQQASLNILPYNREAMRGGGKALNLMIQLGTKTRAKACLSLSYQSCAAIISNRAAGVTTTDRIRLFEWQGQL